MAIIQSAIKNANRMAALPASGFASVIVKKIHLRRKAARVKRFKSNHCSI
jgi:hypothetical protein